MKILLAALKYDYGVKVRGESLESQAFMPALKKIADEFFIFWLEDNGFSSDLSGLQSNLIAYADKVKPDVIFFMLMKDEIKTDTLKYLTDRYITTNWFCDDTWRFNTFTKYVAPYLTFSITNDKYSISNYKKIGCQKVLLSQWATLDYEVNLDLKEVKYKYDISFVGGKNPTREWIVRELKKRNLHVHCFGAGWDHGRVSFNEMKSIFYSSKINLNLSNSVPQQLNFLKFILKNLFVSIFSIFNKKLSDYINTVKTNLKYISFYFWGAKTAEQVKARNFEISGWGGFQITQYALEIEDYYSIGSEIAVFNSVEELAKQCQYYLDNEELRKTICINGHKRTAEHNYYNRMKAILSYLYPNPKEI